MAININELYRFFSFISNKWQGGTPSPEEFDDISKRASWELYMTEIGSEQDYQPGRPIPRIHWQATKKVTEALRPFLSEEKTIPLDTRGRWYVPSDYQYVDYFGFLNPTVKDCETVVDPTTITVLTGDLLYTTLGGYRAPTFSYPHAMEFSDYWQFYPKNLGYIQVRYLKQPNSPHWGYTIPAGQVLPVYDPLTSVDLEWNQDMFNKIVMKMCSYMGINLLENELIAVSEQLKQA